MTASRPAPPSAARILERTIQQIESSGEASLKIRDIAAECGVSPPVIYDHFTNREGLVVAAQAERYARSLREINEPLVEAVLACRSEDEMRAVFDALLEQVFSEERALPRLARASVLGSCVGRPDLTAAINRSNREFVDSLMPALRYARSKGWLRPVLDDEALALWYIGQVNGRSLIEIGDGSGIDHAHWNQVARLACIAVLFGGPAD